MLQADSTFRVQVTLTANLSDSAPPPVENAQVIIESDADTPDTLTYTEKGWYVSPHKVKAGVSYTCKVNISGFPLVSAQASVPRQTEIDTIVYIDLAGRGEEGEKISSVEFSIQNDKTRKQFWQVQLVNEGMKSDYDFETGERFEYFGTTNEYIYMLAGQDSVLLGEANPLILFSNKLMKSSRYRVKFYINENYTHFSEDQTPYIVLRAVDESYYKYLKQYYIYESAGYTDIGKTPQKYPLYSNVTNGYGVFTGISVLRKELLLTRSAELTAVPEGE